MITINYIHGLPLRPNRLGLAVHEHPLILHSTRCEVVDPGHGFYELSRPCRRWASALAERIHRPIRSELERLRRRYIERIGNPLEIGFLRLHRQTHKREQREYA